MSNDKHPARFSVHIVASVCLIVMLALVFILHTLAEKRIEAADDLRHRSFLLATELRLSSDALTRMVRTYVVTGKPAFKKHYQDILDIRDGEKARPEVYGTINWDALSPGGKLPSAESGQKIALLELMRQAGFVPDEFRKLEEAKRHSDELTELEFTAMRLVESGGADLEAKRSKALLMLMDDTYLLAKEGIMKPIGEFSAMVDARTLAAVQAAKSVATALKYLFVAVGLGLVFMLWRTCAALRDITGQRRKEEELRRSEARFRSLVTATAQIVWNASAEGKVSGPLPSWQEYTGQTGEEVQDIGWTRALHPDDVPHAMAAWMKSVETRSLYEVAYRIRRHDGVYRLFAARGAPVLNDNGGVREWIGTCTDITEGHQAQIERDRFFSLTLDLMCIASPDGYFRRVNPAFERTLGYTTEEILNRSFMDFIHPDDVAATQEAVATLASGVELVNFENRYVCKDGSHRWFLWTCVPADGLLYAVARDITDSKQAEADIRELNTKLEQRVIERTTQLAAAHDALREERTLIDAIREAQNQFIVAESSTKIFDGLLASLLKLTGSEYGFIDELFYDAEGKPYLTACAITDISWNEATRKLYPQFLTGELRFKNLKSLFGEVMTTGKPVIANDAPRDPRRGGCPMGHPALNAFLGLPLHAGKDFVGVIGLANRPGGYTEAMLAYLEPMVKACANLIAAQRNEARRRQAEKERQRLLGELEAANKELEAFSYSVSHDLRAPLRGIDSFSRMVIEDHGPKLDADGQRQLNVIRAEAQRMGQLIDELLSFSRLGRKEIKMETFDMTGLAQGVFDDLPAAARQRVKEFRLHPLPPAHGDRAMIRQVLVNLIDNAVKYSAPAEAPVIEVSGETVDGICTYRVKDNGVGFDPRYAHKLFGVFQRLHAEHEFEGTGVGLAIVQRVVHRHGGTVGAEGVLNHGATFSFSLPIKSQNNLQTENGNHD